ncbi:MAG: hypothetical protein ACF8QF_08480 [Phycisphaerales bacterium]
MALVARRDGAGVRVEAPEPRARAIDGSLASAALPDPIGASDLRRRRTPLVVEEVVLRAALLPEADRALLLAVYRDATPARTIAELRGLHVRRVRRRVRSLVQRVLSPRFGFVMDHMASWPRTRRRVAQAVVIEGRPRREASETLGVTIHTVRRRMEEIRLLEQASRAGADTVAPGGGR